MECPKIKQKAEQKSKSAKARAVGGGCTHGEHVRSGMAAAAEAADRDAELVYFASIGDSEMLRRRVAELSKVGGADYGGAAQAGRGR